MPNLGDNPHPDNTCDICGFAPCESPFFCSESRRLDKDPAVLEACARALFEALYPDRPVITRSTLRAAEYLSQVCSQTGDVGRFNDWLNWRDNLPRPAAEKAAILAHLARSKRHG
jgi:hypothetical protein